MQFLLEKLAKSYVGPPRGLAPDLGEILDPSLDCVIIDQFIAAYPNSEKLDQEL